MIKKVTACAVLAAALLVLFVLLLSVGCDTGGGGDSGYLESIKGEWCTGIKSGVTVGSDGPFDAAMLLVMENPSFEFYMLADLGDGYAGLDLAQGWKGEIEDIDDNSITFLVQQQYDQENNEWDPLGEYHVQRYSVDADNLSMILDMSNDAVFDGTNIFEDDCVIPDNTDIKLYAAKEPEEGLTVTGTITFVPAYYDVDAQLAVGLWPCRGADGFRC
jgi:hypothetical protein